MAQCTAKAKSTGKQCRRNANTGYNVCQVHGAGSSKKGRPGGRPVEHGRYADSFKGKLREKFIESYEDGNPLDLLPELAVQRTLLQNYITRFEVGLSPTGRDLKILSDLSNDVVSTATKIINTRNQTALTVAEIKYLQLGITALLDEFIPDTDRRRAFITRLMAIIPQSALTERTNGGELGFSNVQEKRREIAETSQA